MSEPTADIGEPKIREEVAMDKVIDPYSEPFPYSHHTSIHKLASVLNSGLVAERFARRANLQEYKRAYNSSWNDDYVSLWRSSIYYSIWPYISIMVNPRGQIISADEIKSKKTDTQVTLPGEFLVKNRISPSEFTGLVIGDREPSNPDVISYDERYGYEYYGPGDPRNSWGLAIVPLEAVLEITNKLDPSQSLPIYKGSEGLVWPTRMSPEELRERAKRI